MAIGGMWHRTLVYFGLADEDEEYEDETLGRPAGHRVDVQGAGEREEDRAKQPPPAVHRFRRHLRGGEQLPHPARGSGPYPWPAAVEQAPVRVHLVMPKNFNDAQIIADKFKGDIPVIFNLQSSETELAKRLIDFASGLTYALDGGMQRVADKVFLLTPKNVEVSAEERQRSWRRASSTSPNGTAANQSAVAPPIPPVAGAQEDISNSGRDDMGTTVGVVGPATWARRWCGAGCGHRSDLSFLVYDVDEERAAIWPVSIV